MQSPCAGSVTTWRVNAAAAAAFRLRIIRDNGGGTFTSTASSGVQTTAGAGIATFTTNLPISAGQYIGIDLNGANVIVGRNQPSGPPTSANLFIPSMVDGNPEVPNFYNSPYLPLVNADVACSQPLTVVKAGSGQGTVTSSPAGISCGATCSAGYPEGTTVTLTAAAASGSTFTGWSGGGCGGTSACVIAIGGPTSVTATFAASNSTGGSTATEDRKCSHLRKKLKRQKRRLAAATEPTKRAMIEANIEDTKQRLKKLACS